jgi:hypothetical protein
MASSMARDGRRRRVLNDEVRSASGASAAASGAPGAAAADAPRYGEQASIEHHPQITDFVPRRMRTVATVVVAGAGVAALSQAAVRFAANIAALVPGAAEPLIAGQLAAGLAAWTSAVALLLTAALARIIYSLRRHRISDVSGRYRVWRWVAVGALLASVNAVVGAHAVFAHVATTLTGWSLTTAGSEWWLSPLAIVGAWIGVRLALEIGESRTALAAMVLAGVCYALAAAGALGWSPAALAGWSTLLTGGLPLLGHALLLAAMMVFARYVVLDVQGLIEHKPRRARAPQARPATSKTAATTASSSSPAGSTLAPKPAAASLAAASSAPAPGRSDDDDDADEEDDDAYGDRPLSKAERKRLRKQQRRNRAA